MTDSSGPSPERANSRFRALPLIGPMIGSPVFEIPDYRRLWVGAACNHFGMTGEQVIIGLLVFQITESSAWVGVALALYFAPLLVFGPLAGAIADWMDRRVLLRRIELVIALNLMVFCVLVSIGPPQLWILLLFTLVSGSVRALYQPVRSSYAYDIVGGGQVVAGLSLLNLGTRLGQLAGALIAGSVMQRLGTPVAFLMLALVHLAAFAMLSRLHSAGLASEIERVPMSENLREYFNEIRSNQTLLVLLVVTASVEMLGFSFSTVLPELATSRLGVGAEGLGMMHAARASGGIAAAIFLARGLRRQGIAFLSVIYAFGGSLLLLACAPTFTFTVCALILVAAMALSSDILTQSMMQLSVPNRLRGRAMGVWGLAIGAAPIGHLEMGALAASFGVGVGLAINGGCLIAIAVLVTIVAPRLRKL